MGIPEPLAGVRIVDLSQVASGPYATSLLGDFGADVIKVEPIEGEPFRMVDDLYGPTDSGYFFGVNRSKRAIALDLKSSEAYAVLEKLLEHADVMVVSMRPQALVALRIDYETLHQRFPGLIYCTITAYGDDGPRAHLPGMDILAQALGGLMGTTGEPGRPPVKVGPPILDFSNAYIACYGILAALRVKDKSGVGQKVSVNLLSTSVGLLANFVTPYIKSGVPVRPTGGGHPQIVPYQTFLASDRWLVVACLTERFWMNLCRAIERPDLATDVRFKANMDRMAHRDELTRILGEVFITRTATEWENILIQHEVPVAQINLLEDVLKDPQVVHAGLITSLEHPRYGSVPVVNNPISMNVTPPRPRRYPPGVGEHTNEVLREAGLSDEEIGNLKKSGVVR